MSGSIAFQGVPGAYSDLACRFAYPAMTTLPCESFETAMDAVREGRVALAMLPCENSLAGRVPDIHHLLPDSGLFVVGEHFQRVEHCLLRSSSFNAAWIMPYDSSRSSSGDFDSTASTFNSVESVADAVLR